MSPCNRRTFMIGIAATCATLGATHAAAQVDEGDPQAAALGFKTDTTKVDAKKYPNHANNQTCNNCQLYQGKPTDPVAGCTLFGGKQVPAKGWCSAWVKKAA